MTKLSIAGGADIERKSLTTEVVEELRELADSIERGEERANRLVMITADHRVDSFDFRVFHVGRALECLGLIEVLRDTIKAQMAGE